MRVVIAGADGRMGQMLLRCTLSNMKLLLSGALVAPGSILEGQDAGGFVGQVSGIKLSSQPAEVLIRAECLIDFTRPEGTMHYVPLCEEHGVGMVIGTTGFTKAQLKRIEKASENIPIVLSPNMSLGVNVVLQLLDQAAQLLDDRYDIEIIEAHHKHKVDAPSGTALKMGEVLAKARGITLSRKADWARHGHTGERRKGNIGFSVVRGGDIVGDHKVLFCGTGETIEIGHRAQSRESFAQGALQAAMFLKGKKQGLFSMQDVIAYLIG